MTFPALPDAHGSAQLHACLRDLVGLMGLPALWSGKEPLSTVRLLAETLMEILALDACGMTTALAGKSGPLRILLVDGAYVDEPYSADWLRFVEGTDCEKLDLNVTEEMTPRGLLCVARFSLGYFGYKGRISVASSRPDFPLPTELILLRSAASLAASGLRSAQLTQEREKALRAKDEFLAMLGHELRNPMAPIVTAIELLKLKADGVFGPELAVIERQVTHLRGLVDDLLDVTRITSGKIELRPETVELHAVVLHALEAAQPLIEQRRHRLVCEVPATGMLVRADPLRLAQVFSNLLINAAKYSGTDGNIQITAFRESDRVQLQVKDDGMGIHPDLLPHVFDLFEQGVASIDRSGGGLGIGLSVVRALVAMHEGSVRADSPGVERGSTFTVTLALAKTELPAAVPPVPHAVDRFEKNETVLVVDDNQDAANSLAELLRAYGYRTEVRYGPHEALALCEKMQLSVVIVDIGLPGISGYELAAMIRACHQADPPRIIAVTGYGQPADHARSKSAQIEAHLTKPVMIEELLAHIGRSGPCM